MRCPGQDQRYWTPDDIFDLRCPYCGNEIEFWKDEPFRICKECSREIRNPRINLGCAKWCKNADACLGRSAGDDSVAAPVVERLAAALEFTIQDNDRLKSARIVCRRADDSLTPALEDPLSAKAVAFLMGALLATPRYTDDAIQTTLETVMERAQLDSAAVERIRTVANEVVSGMCNLPESQLIRSVLEQLD